jgi:hypothetical protein
MQDELITQLKQNVLVLEFVKADQSLRRMRATLNPVYLPALSSTPGSAKQTPGVIRVWDMDLQAWRSVPVSRLISHSVELSA